MVPISSHVYVHCCTWGESVLKCDEDVVHCCGVCKHMCIHGPMFTVYVFMYIVHILYIIYVHVVCMYMYVQHVHRGVYVDMTCTCRRVLACTLFVYYVQVHPLGTLYVL